MDYAETTVTAPGAQREPNDDRKVDPASRDHVKKWCERLNSAKKHHEPAFKKMRRNQKFAANTANEQWDGQPDKYTANLIQRHVQQKTATLYAKNPRAVARRRPRREFAKWDEDPSSFMQAMEMMEVADPVSPESIAAQALVQDVLDGMQRRHMYENMGITLQTMFHYYLDEHRPKFKAQFKQMIRRAIICSVGYVKIDFQRDMERSPDTILQIQDATQQIATLERLKAQQDEGEFEETDAKARELRATVVALMAEPDSVVAREALTFGFPRSTQVIIDPDCTQLQEFVGARWLAVEYMLRPEEIREIYSVDIGKEFRAYVRRPSNLSANVVDSEYNASSSGEPQDGDLAAIWEVYDRKTGTVFTIADGYCDYLRPPAPPHIKLERFFPIYAYTLNELENEFELYPQSDVELLMDMQHEYNRSREGLREHRQANRPFYAETAGTLEHEDKKAIQDRLPHEIVSIHGMPPGTKVGDILQAVTGAPIDPLMYEVRSVFEDTQRVVGTQESRFGGVSKATATEVTIAESAVLSSADSNIDDLNDMLTDIARDAGQILLMNCSKETAIEIVGPGAVWPEFSRDQVAKELYLEVLAGSTGRPNKATEIANIERLTPLLVQVPGIRPDWLAREMIKRMDDGIDLTDAILPNLPSIMAINAQAGQTDQGAPQPGTGDPQTDPSAQGPQGANNAPGGPQSRALPNPVGATASRIGNQLETLTRGVA